MDPSTPQEPTEEPTADEKALLYLELLQRKQELETLWPRWTPNPKQAPFVASESKFRCFNGGFGAGKTYGGCQEDWRAAREHPGSLGLIVAPSYPELRDYTQRTFFEQIGVDAETADRHPLVASFSKTEQHLKLINGSEIFFRSADKPGTLVGSTVDWFHLDEPASTAPITWKMLIGRLRGQVGPRRGWATGTPQGYNWVWREFAENVRENYSLFTASTMDNARNLPADYIEAMQESYTGVFARANIYGEFVAFEGQVYEFSRGAHLVSASKVGNEWIGWEPNPDLPYDRTADFGTNNPTAWLWVQEIGGVVYVFDEYEVRRTAVDEIAPVLKSRWQNLAHAQDFGDVAGQQRDSNLMSYVSNYGKNGIFIRTRPGGAVKAGVEVISRYLAPGENDLPRLYVHPRCQRLIAAFETYHWPEDVDGKRDSDEPVKDGVSDHLMDALRYWFVNRHPEQFRRTTVGGQPEAGQRTYASGRPGMQVTRSSLLPPSDLERMGTPRQFGRN